MNYQVWVCDKCPAKYEGKTESPYQKEGWVRINIEARENIGYQYYSKMLIICPRCAKKIGFLNKKEDGRSIKSDSIEDRLYDIAQEIIENLQEQRR